MSKLFQTFFIIFIFTGFSQTASAKTNKIISGELVSAFFNNYTYDSDDRKNEYNENYLRLKLKLKVNFNKNLYLDSQLTFKETTPESEELQRSASSNGGGNKSFEDEALYIKKLNLNYNYKNLTLTAGKFTTNFGNSWRRRDNIWLFEKARKEYRQDEKLGFSSYLQGGDKRKNGLYQLKIATFTNDTKYLEGSVITKKDNTNKEDGTVGDKKGFKSYILSLDTSYDFGNKEELSYHLAYINLAVNENQSPINKEKIEDMEGYALNMNYKYPISQNILGEGFVEYINFNNHDGSSDKDIDYLTTTLSFYFFQKYNISLGRYQERSKEITSNGVNKDIRELNFGYIFDKKSALKGFKIIAGLKIDETDYKTYEVTDNGMGLMAYYKKKF